MITAAQFRRVALSLADVAEAPHMERTAFRTPARIFTTLGPSGTEANVRLPLEVQEMVVASMPDAFRRLDGGWGRMGWTRMSLAAVSLGACRQVLEEAHAFAAPKPKAKKVRKARNARPAPRTSVKKERRAK